MARRDETATGITQRDRVEKRVSTTRDGFLVDATGLPIGPPGARDGRAATIALIGDSLTDNNYSNAGNLQAYSSRGYWTWAAMLLGQRVTLVNESGVGGNKSGDVLTRLQSDMLDYAPRWGLVMVGVNDLLGGLSASAIAANLQQIYTRMRGAGITPIACTVTPATYSAPQIEQWTILNAWIVDYCRANGWMLCLDAAAAIMSSTDGAPVSGATDDGIHHVTVGAVPTGRALFDLLDPLVPRIPPTSVSLMTVGATQRAYNVNGMAWGNNAGGANGFSLGTGITGTGPNNWVTGRTGTTTAVASKVARSDWRAGEFFRMAVTVGGANEQVFCGPSDVILRYWATGLSVNLNDIVRPTAPNGAAYRVTTAGALSTGSDPTAGWSTTPGASFTSGGATLKVMDSADVGASIYAQCRVNLSAWSGAFCPVLQLWQYTASYASIVKKAVGCNWGGADALPSNIPAGEYVLRTPTMPIDPACAILHVQMGIYGGSGVTGNLDVAEVEVRRDPAPSVFRPGT